MAIELEGDNINDLPLDEIVRRAAKPEHAIWGGGGSKVDYLRNHYVLRLFDGAGIFEPVETLTVAGIVDRWPLFPRAGTSRQFNALRLGELINWAVVHGIAAPVAGQHGCWQLLVREMQFEMCGPERKQVAVRVRGLTGEAAIAAEKIWQRELKRRERARAKYVAGVIETINIEIDFISRHAPETKLPETLSRFAVGEHDTIVAVRELITDAVPAMSAADATALGQAVHAVYSPIMQGVIDRAAEERKRQREEARRQEEAELAALAEMFPPPPPPPPPPPLLADIRSTSSRFSTTYEIEGSLEDVRLAIARIEKHYHPCGYGTRFDAPVEIAGGRWLATGGRSNSCD